MISPRVLRSLEPLRGHLTDGCMLLKPCICFTRTESCTRRISLKDRLRLLRRIIMEVKMSPSLGDVDSDCVRNCGCGSDDHTAFNPFFWRCSSEHNASRHITDFDMAQWNVSWIINVIYISSLTGHRTWENPQLHQPSFHNIPRQQHCKSWSNYWTSAKVFGSYNC